MTHQKKVESKDISEHQMDVIERLQESCLIDMQWKNKKAFLQIKEMANSAEKDILNVKNESQKDV